ncbi:MAG TPA: hypothetical protein VL048_20775 [Xanthobacteraceae bacterium]|nr:hypothetical protein [Xanthobacteraceae bacterium]
MKLFRAKVMNSRWSSMTDREKLEIVRSDVHRLEATLSALLSELDVTWNAMKETRIEIGKITKDVATLRSLWPQKYSRTG